MAIRKGLLLCGGEGLRMRPFSLGGPKQLLPVLNRPVAAHARDELWACGIRDLVVVTAAHKVDAFRQALGDGAAMGGSITYVAQPAPLGLAHAVAAAAPALGGEPFLMQLGDNLVPGGAGRLAAALQGPEAPAAAVLVAPTATPWRYGIAVTDGRGQVRRLVEKPALAPGQLALVGVYAFTPAIYAAIAAIGPSARGELEITDALQWLVAAGRPVVAVEHPAWWGDIGTPQDLLAANLQLLPAIAPGLEGTVTGSRLTGRVAVGAGSRVEGCLITGPVLIGAGCQVHDANLGPLVAVGDGAALRSCRISRSVILPEAVIDAPAGWIRHSVIGRSARVSGGVDLELVVGDHGQVRGV